MITFHLKRAGQADERIEIDASSVVVGRSSDCDLVIRDPHVSNRHVRVMRGLVVQDLDSRNGTFLGEERLKGARLVEDHERLELSLGRGDVRLEFAPEEAPESPRRFWLPQRPRVAADAIERVRELEEEVARLRERLGQLEPNLRRVQGS